MTEQVIRLYFCDPCIITAEEYDQIQHDVEARLIAGDYGPGERVLLRLLKEHRLRREEIRHAKVPDQAPVSDGHKEHTGVLNASKEGVQIVSEQEAEVDIIGDTITCILCGLTYARRFSADIRQCFRCHWLLNRLLAVATRDLAAARDAWWHYTQAIDVARMPNEPAPANWPGVPFG